jgi:c-di-AMP phosphodiesterase-like protein
LGWLFNNYGTITAIFSVLLTIIVTTKRWGTHAIRTIMLGNRFICTFGHDPSEAINQLFHSVRASHETLEIRQQISERYLKIGVYISDLEGRWTWTNDCLGDIFGKDSRDMLGLKWLNGIHSRDRQRVHESWAYCLTNDLDHQSTFTICNCRSNLSIEVRATTIIVLGEGNKRQCYVGYLTVGKATKGCEDCGQEDES